MIQVNTKNITNIDNWQQLERQKTHNKYESLRHNKLKKVFKTITTTNTILTTVSIKNKTQQNYSKCHTI